MTQLTFEDIADVYEGIAPHIKDAFLNYHQENPSIYSMFKVYALQLKKNGLYQYGAKAIMERIRWHFEVERSDQDFKINNNYASCFARLLMAEDPTFKDFFETRSRCALKAA